MPGDVVAVLAAQLPAAVRWAGAIARQLRRHDIALGGKSSGSAATDALTLADLALQELLVAALRDAGPLVRACRLEAEERTGDLAAFAREGDAVIGLDPIDGTLAYRDRTHDGYAVMLHLRGAETVRYSLVYLPEAGATGLWLEARDGRVALGPDDPTRAARAVLDAMPARAPAGAAGTRRVVLSSRFALEAAATRAIADAGFEPVFDTELGDSIFPLLARGELAGVVYHTPNVYDFPVAAHLVRLFGGDAVSAHTGRPMDFRAVWRDERSNMLRLPGIVACAPDRAVVDVLATIARDWNPERYP